MKYRIRASLAAALVFWSAAMTAAWQSPGKPSSAKIPECEKYDAMVTSCLPKMCEDERMLTEMDLGFHRELLPATIQHKGRQGAAELCARQIDEAIKDDLYGCYSNKTGAAGVPARPIRLDKLSATDTSVVLTLGGNRPTTAGSTEVIILTGIGEPPTAIYRLPEWKGQFVLDTASASPIASAKGGAQNPPMRLEPRTTYCFVITSSTDRPNDVYRKGTFTTLPKR
jgi:hypothetical protein